MAEGSGYNPYRKANGEFASASELGSVEEKVSADLTEARNSGDAERVAQVEEYAMDKAPNSKLGKQLLEERYGSTPSSSKTPSTEDRYEALRSAYREATPPGDFSYQAQIDLGHSLKALSDSEFDALASHNGEQLTSGRTGRAWDQGLEGGIGTERIRRSHAERFAELESDGYEYDGLGKYVSPDRTRTYFVAPRGMNRGQLVVRENVGTGRMTRLAAHVDGPSSQPEGSTRERLEAAGVKYPLGWNDMGSSEKDLWEERQLRNLS